MSDVASVRFERTRAAIQDGKKASKKAVLQEPPPIFQRKYASDQRGVIAAMKSLTVVQGSGCF